MSAQGERHVATPSEEEPVRVLLVEDDDGDAVLVESMFEDGDLDVSLGRARSVDEALGMLDVDCVLLDLGLPDSVGLSGVTTLRAATDPPALIVLTGLASAATGVAAVAAGAQDYLVKNDVDADLLARSVRYAVQRRRSDEQERTIYRNAVRAEETARLERALLPRPVVRDAGLSVHVGYLPGGSGLLGGDFYDVLERPDGSLACIVGDVAGHGPDEAALGATLRTAWRTLVLAGTPVEEVLPLVDRVLVHERSRPETFTTLCQVVVSPDRTSADLYLAGHPAPILLGDPSAPLPADGRGPALGVPVERRWDATHVELGDTWWFMLYTDGLLETTILDAPTTTTENHSSRTAARLGLEGLLEAVDVELATGTDDLVERLLHRVRAAHGGRLVDDAAVLVVGWPGRGDLAAGRRTATLADAEEWQ